MERRRRPTGPGNERWAAHRPVPPATVTTEGDSSSNARGHPRATAGDDRANATRVKPGRGAAMGREDELRVLFTLLALAAALYLAVWLVERSERDQRLPEGAPVEDSAPARS